ncbi:hypothetical protein ACIP6P_27535 [Streptomyces sp. NPDC088729]|uniref:hypothetical protein n=1 Tax=Streptomyces sp. NPDC088729 TaxID=3365876 RepID=UPI0037F87C61
MDAEGHVMADEHDEWLDKDAAERLLRGEPVVPVGARARGDALRLARALDAARATGRPSGGELPGEERALAAFRQAARAGSADRTAGRDTAAQTARSGALPSVRIGSAPAEPPRRPRWSRPVRFGLVVSLAGCALGGVAVATGTGILAGPFAGRSAPAPAASVSAAGSPEPLVTGRPADDPSASLRPTPPDEPAPPSIPPERRQPGPSQQAGDPPGPTDRPDADDDGTDGGGRTDGGGDEDAPDDSTEREEHEDGWGQGSSENWYEKSLKACKALHGGTLDGRDRRRLRELAKGENDLERFCSRLLGGAGDGGDHGGGDGDPGPGGPGGPGGNEGGSLPPVSFLSMPPGDAGSLVGPPCAGLAKTC